ncbi:FUSC family protein [Peijinzhouia sedimentorum]
MSPNELAELSDQELLEEARKLKSSSILHATLIGFMLGVIIYSVVKNTWGLVSLIPLFFIYKLSKNSTRDKTKTLKRILKERNLK